MAVEERLGGLFHTLNLEVALMAMNCNMSSYLPLHLIISFAVDVVSEKGDQVASLAEQKLSRAESCCLEVMS